MDNSVNFSDLIFGFSSAALYYLGETEVEGKTVNNINLPLAKQNIDFLILLKEKTIGNLTEEESKLIGQLLMDLQAKYVEKRKK